MMAYTTLAQQFFLRVQNDQRMHTLHICLYMTLLYCWSREEGRHPFSISRSAVMKASKIEGVATYHRGMKQLQEYGYILYIPSYHPVLASRIYLLDLPQQAPL